MARALLLALTCAAAASAARYVDYSGVKMPAYGSVAAADYDAPRDGGAPASDDYRGQSPDAPASPDYKYEEEPRIKTEKPMKDSEDTEVWRKPGRERKQRGLIRIMDSATADVIHKFQRSSEEDFPKLRPSHRYAKHRTRLKQESPARDEESPSRRPIKYSRDRKDVVSDIDRKDYFNLDKDDFPEGKSKEFDEDAKFLNEATTRRRRKPRDRQVKRKSSDLDLAYDDEQDLEPHLKGEVEKEPPHRTRPPDARPADRFRTLDDEDEETRVQPASKARPKAYDDYDDYYDMKRVNSIKSKLPSLLRRTTERASRPSATSYLDKLWTNRRMLPPGRKRFEDEEDDQADNHLEHNRRVAPPAPTTPPPPPTTTTGTTTTTTTSTTTTTTTTTPAITIPASSALINSKELSLAEKSRLSILKKDQRKEGLHIDPPTKKPPVLLQVTRYVPTVVMVEPPSSIIPWMRASEVSDDNPERLNRVKKLMRHKLVANSKNINELTENWDQQVCDYVDTALLENGACALRLQRTVRACTLLALACTLLNSWIPF